MPDLSVIIVSWNVREALLKNLERLFSLSHRVTYEVIVVDNGSADGTPAMIRQRFPRVHLIQNDTNRGFAHACNQGLKHACGGILLLLNPDMVLNQGVLDHTCATLRARPDIGVMGVALVRPDGSMVPSVRRDPTLLNQLAVLLKVSYVLPCVLDRYLASDFDYERSGEVEQVRGSFFAFSRKVYERVGPLDAKNFFLWFEEVDYCRRVREAGWKIWYEAQVSCVDLAGQSFKQQPAWLKQAWFSHSMARYVRKWHGLGAAVIIYALRPCAIALCALADVFHFSSWRWR